MWTSTNNDCSMIQKYLMKDQHVHAHGYKLGSTTSSSPISRVIKSLQSTYSGALAVTTNPISWENDTQHESLETLWISGIVANRLLDVFTHWLSAIPSYDYMSWGPMTYSTCKRMWYLPLGAIGDASPSFGVLKFQTLLGLTTRRQVNAPVTHASMCSRCSWLTSFSKLKRRDIETTEALQRPTINSKSH